MATVASLDRVKRVVTDDDSPRPILLLGAGASIKSGVPGAATLADQMARLGYCQDHNRDPRDQSVTKSDWIEWLRGRPWYREDLRLEERYSRLVECVLQPREVRKKFFERAVRERYQPSAGYEALADLVGKGWFRTLLTTNFDDLIYQSCRSNVESASVMTVRGPHDAHLISTDPTAPQVIHLHGSVEYYSDCNLPSELETLDKRLVNALRPLLKDHPLIVIGYRGAERSVMNDLLLGTAAEPGGFRHGVYWCVLDREDPHPLVRELDHAIPGSFFFVEVDGFDEAMVTLNDGTPRKAGASGGERWAAVPELLPAHLDLDDLDWALIKDRLPAVARQLDVQLDEPITRASLENVLTELGLATVEDGRTRPTRAAELLFSKHSPSRAVFEWRASRRELRGNLCQLLDDCRDALNEVNAPFRLKGPVSENVRSYEPLALKEVLVNALAHRDHSSQDPIEIRVSERDITVRSPGGTVDTVDAGQLGRVAVRGYRNPILANFFYGTGDMDKRGSGLVDVRLWSQDIGGDAEFSVASGNTVFTSTILARPERPEDDLAKPGEGYEVFYANALPVQFERGLIEIGATPARERHEIFERHPGRSIAPFVLQAGELITFSELGSPSNPLTSEIVGSAKRLPVNEFCGDSADERIVAELLNEGLRRHARNLGMRILYRDQRLYFPKTDDGERTITYHARVRDARRRVVKKRSSATTGEVIYWEHHAVRWQFRRFADQWCLLLVPGWVFTKDGEEQLLDPRRTTRFSTRRAAKDYNQQVLAHVHFWAAMLVGEERYVTVTDGSAAISLGRSPLSAHLAGVPATPGVERDVFDLEDASLAELESELEDAADRDEAGVEEDDV